MPSHRRLLLTTAVLLGLSLVGSSALTTSAEAEPRTPAPPTTYTAAVETPPNFDDEAGGDADADDPAIWVHRSRPTRSVVLGALKNGGLDAYDLRGRVLQHIDTPPAPGEDLAAGRFNNVDILTRTAIGDIAVVTDRGRDRLRTYRISRVARPPMTGC